MLFGRGAQMLSTHTHVIECLFFRGQTAETQRTGRTQACKQVAGRDRDEKLRRAHRTQAGLCTENGSPQTTRHLLIRYHVTQCQRHIGRSNGLLLPLAEALPGRAALLLLPPPLLLLSLIHI